MRFCVEIAKNNTCSQQSWRTGTYAVNSQLTNSNEEWLPLLPHKQSKCNKDTKRMTSICQHQTQNNYNLHQIFTISNNSRCSQCVPKVWTCITDSGRFADANNIPKYQIRRNAWDILRKIFFATEQWQSSRNMELVCNNIAFLFNNDFQYHSFRLWV